MDIRDILTHDTYFDEFIILSGDADFTPVLHRLRAHARRTVVFANDHTAQPYTALSDGEIRELNLIALLTSSRTLSGATTREITTQPAVPAIDVEAARKAVLSEVIDFVRNAPQAVPLETLADRAVRIVGREKTVGTNWGGYGSFRELLLADLPEDIHLSDTAPYTVFDGNRHISATGLIAPQLAPPAAEPRRREALMEAPSAQPQPEVTADFAAHANAGTADGAAAAVSEHFPAFEPAALQRDAKRRRCAGAANHRVAHCRQRTGTAFATDRVVDFAAPQPDCPSPATAWLPN